MFDTERSLREDFPPVKYDDWRKLAEDSLRGAPFEKKLVTHLYEEIDLQPLYTQADRSEGNDANGFPGLPPFVRGSEVLGSVLSGWDLRQEHSTPHPAAANTAILEDLNGGVTSLLLVLNHTARTGFDPDHSAVVDSIIQDGIMVHHANDLESALANVDLSTVGIALESGAAFLPIATILATIWKRRNISPQDASGAFNADPLAVLARTGQLPMSIDSALAQMSDLAAWTSTNYPNVTAVSVDTSPYHHAGASATQDLAFALATAVQYLRVMTEKGIGIDIAASQMLFRISLGTHHFLSIAKLRAARQLWSRVIELCGGTSGGTGMRIHTRLSDRVQTRLDPYVNLLRNTVGIFAAGIGGANAITSVPFDHTIGQPNSFSRRLARNTGLILQEEAHLNRVIDPAGGSWFFENLTEQVAEKAWVIFQEVESQGGMCEALQSGWVAEQIAAAHAPRAKDIATRKQGITGVSEFPDLEQAPISRPQPDPQQLQTEAIQRVQAFRNETASIPSLESTTDITLQTVQVAESGATIGQLAQALGFHKEQNAISPLIPQRFVEPFESLRDASERWFQAHGNRPKVFLANMGPLAHHTARATYSKSFFEAGGFEVATNEGFKEASSATQAFVESGAKIAVICSSDKLYPEIIPELASELKLAGARNVIVAGRPGELKEQWQNQGVDRFIYISCDVLSTLRSLLKEEGVI